MPSLFWIAKFFLNTQLEIGTRTFNHTPSFGYTRSITFIFDENFFSKNPILNFCSSSVIERVIELLWSKVLVRNYDTFPRELLAQVFESFHMQNLINIRINKTINPWAIVLSIIERWEKHIRSVNLEQIRVYPIVKIQFLIIYLTHHLIIS